MNSLWPWIGCFNALALGVTDLDAGLNQLMLPFALQQEDGQLPDKTGRTTPTSVARNHPFKAGHWQIDGHASDSQFHTGNDLSQLVNGRIFGSRNAITMATAFQGFREQPRLGFRLG